MLDKWSIKKLVFCFSQFSCLEIIRRRSIKKYRHKSLFISQNIIHFNQLIAEHMQEWGEGNSFSSMETFPFRCFYFEHVWMRCALENLYPLWSWTLKTCASDDVFEGQGTLCRDSYCLAFFAVFKVRLRSDLWFRSDLDSMTDCNAILISRASSSISIKQIYIPTKNRSRQERKRKPQMGNDKHHNCRRHICDRDFSSFRRQ